MGEEKFASLSSGLLARKGAAKPAMRRQGYMNPQGDVAEDLGWNDMGYTPPRPIDGNDDRDGHEDYDERAVEPPAIHEQIGRLAEGFAVHQPEPAEDIDEDDAVLDGHAGLSAMDDGEEAIEERDETAEYEPEFYGEEASAPEPIEPEEEPQVAEVIPMRPSAPEPSRDKILARDKVAFTLRLDKERHLKLRLASALENRSAQQLVTEALDSFFKAMPDLDRLAANSRDRK